MQHLTDRRVTSCIHYASDIIEERTGWRLPVPRPMASKDDYKKQLEEEKINLRPITELEDSCLILYKNGNGYHVGVYIDDLNRVVHGAAKGKSVASRISDMNRAYQVVAMYRVQGGQPGDFDENLPKAELFDPGSIILVAIAALAAGQLIKRWLDRDVNLPESEPEDTRNLVGGRNRIRPDDALPWTAGRIRAYPDFSIPPYNRNVGRANDRGDLNAPLQEWRAGVNWGVGRLRLDQLRLGETDFLQFLAFDSPNSFDVVGAANERPPYWEQNVGGARARTETFSVFTTLDYREPGFIQFTTGQGGGEGLAGSGDFLPGAAGIITPANIPGFRTSVVPTDIPNFVLDRELVQSNLETFDNNVIESFSFFRNTDPSLTAPEALDQAIAREISRLRQTGTFSEEALQEIASQFVSFGDEAFGSEGGEAGGDDSGAGGGGGSRPNDPGDLDRP